MNKRIKEVRTDIAKMNQTDFGKKIELTRSAICKIESGENNPSDQTIRLICNSFNVNENWLRTGEGERTFGIDRENQLMAWAGSMLKEENDSFKRRFVRMLMELSEDDWKFLEEKAKMLLSGTDK